MSNLKVQIYSLLYLLNLPFFSDANALQEQKKIAWTVETCLFASTHLDNKNIVLKLVMSCSDIRHKTTITLPRITLFNSKQKRVYSYPEKKTWKRVSERLLSATTFKKGTWSETSQPKRWREHDCKGEKKKGGKLKPEMRAC